jgi:NAD(P)-dependent dehydrogenase (short-subunit alcohol dehydrogenase family)
MLVMGCLAKMRLANEVAVITGSANGIGRATAHLFAREGAKVVIADIDATNGEQAAKTIREAGGKASFLRIDVSQEDQCRELALQTVKYYGNPTILHTNPYWQPHKSVGDTSTEEWQKCLDVCLHGTYFCVKYVLPYMLEARRGSIINTSSVQAFSGLPNSGVYMVAKAALIGFTRSLAIDYGRQGIRANVLCPGPITDDPFVEPWKSLGEKKTVIGRVGTFEEVAYAGLFLASQESSFITGAVIVIDGGETVFH